MQKKRWFMLAGVLAAMVALAVVVAACGDDDDGGSTPATTEPEATEPADAEPADQGTLVDVTMTEFSVTSLVDTVPAGTVKFVVRNTGDQDRPRARCPAHGRGHGRREPAGCRRHDRGLWSR